MNREAYQFFLAITVTILLFTYHFLYQGVNTDPSEILVMSAIHFKKLIAQNMQYKISQRQNLAKQTP